MPTAPLKQIAAALVSCSIAFASGAAAQTAAAQSQRASFDRLEQDFWLCDYALARNALDSLGVMACSEINEKFKKARFNGDWEALQVWWQQNKDARYRAIEASLARDVARRAPAAQR